MRRRDDLDPLELAEEALEHPADFAYYGDLHEADGWGRAFAIHRDSDTLERSNWTVITSDLLERFPGEFVTERYTHWLVGWLETGRIRVLHNPSLGIHEFNLTDAFHAVTEWRQRLADYPIADEDHYSQLEWDELHDYIKDELPWILRTTANERTSLPADLIQRITDLVTEQCSRADDVTYEELETAVRHALDAMDNR